MVPSDMIRRQRAVLEMGEPVAEPNGESGDIVIQQSYGNQCGGGICCHRLHLSKFNVEGRPDKYP